MAKKMTKDEQVADFISKGKDTRFKSGENAAEKGRKGGIKSGEVRREKSEQKRSAREAARFVLERRATTNDMENMKRLNATEDDCITNMEVIMARLWTMWMGGNLEAGKMLMEYAGYDAKENRAERESLSAEIRRQMESEAKLRALGSAPDGATMSINMGDEDGHEDVVFYIPQMLNEKDCQAEDTEPAEEDAKTEQ